MMSQRAIREHNREAAERAAQRGEEPMIIEEEDLDAIREQRITLPHVDTDAIDSDKWRQVEPEEVFGEHRAIQDLAGDRILRVEAGAMGVTKPTASFSEFADMLETGYAYATTWGDPASAGVAVFKRVF